MINLLSRRKDITAEFIMLFLIAFVLRFVLSSGVTSTEAPCRYEFDGLDTNITIDTNVAPGDIIYSFSITKEGGPTELTATLETNTDYYSVVNNSILVKQCPSEETLGVSATLEFSMTDMDCDLNGFLDITVNKARPKFSVCTDFELYAARVPDVSFIDVVKFDLGTVRECASFECEVESSSDLHFQVDPSGSNTIQSSPNVELGKLHELNLTCGRPRVSENVISINVTFTNATSVCREHSNATGMVATTRVSTITDTDVLSTSPTQFCREEEQDAIDRQTFIATATTVSGASAVGFGGVALYAVKRGRCQKKPNDESGDDVRDNGEVTETADSSRTTDAMV